MKEYFYESTLIRSEYVKEIILVIHKIIRNLKENDELRREFTVSMRQNLINDQQNIPGNKTYKRLKEEIQLKVFENHINESLQFLLDYLFDKFPRSSLRKQSDYDRRVKSIQEALPNMFIDLANEKPEDHTSNIIIRLLKDESIYDKVVYVRKIHDDISYVFNLYKCGIHLFTTIMESMVHEISLEDLEID